MRTLALSVVTALFFVVGGTAFAEDPDVTPPKLFNVKLTNKIFKVGKKNTALITKDAALSAKKKKKIPVGTTIKFTLEENTYVAIAVFKAVEGREEGADCVKPTDANEKNKVCVRPVYINTMQRIGKPGPNAIPFSGRLDGKKLKTGAYAFGIIVSDVAGNQTPIVTKSFSIIKG